MRFSEILFVATAVTGVVWVGDHLYRWMKKPATKEPWWIEYPKSFFPVLFIVLILRSFVAEPFRIPTGSMRRTLLEGDFIVVNKYTYGLKLPFMKDKILSFGHPKRGDIIIFKHTDNGESLDLIKRVVGVPGDFVEYKNNQIFINGEPMKQTFIQEIKEKAPNGQYYPAREFTEDLGDKKHEILVQSEVDLPYPNASMTVPENSYYVIGDNRDNSKDSRMWGPVPDEAVQGKAIGIWMSWDHDNHRIRWNRITFDLK